MKILGIINLVIFFPALAILPLVLIMSPSDNMSSSDLTIVLGAISGVILSIPAIVIKKHSIVTTVPFGLLSIFVHIVTIGQIKYWADYYNDVRGDYSFYFIILYSACLLSSFLLLLMVLRQTFVDKQAKADT